MPPDADTFATDAPGKPQEKPLNPRHEAFCQYFVLGGNATYAARAAKYSPQSSGNQGYRLMRHPRIRARIAEIRRGLARDYALDAQVLLGKLEALYQRAVEDHHFHAGVRAVEAQARIAGHLQRRAVLPAAATNLPAPAAQAPGLPAGGMTTHDDFPADLAAAKVAKSSGCANKAAENDDFRTTP